MTKSPIPVFIISCERDISRRARALASCAAHSAAVRVIDAIDARDGLHVFKPYADLLRSDFWGGPHIKPGALACFISHRLAWQALIDSPYDHALIMEDDSVLVSSPSMVSETDLYFCNDRLVAWQDHFGTQTVQALIEVLSTSEFDPKANGLSRAPGADGYIISKAAAETLIRIGDQDGIRCGVDWYLLMVAAGLEPAWSGQGIKEIQLLVDMFGARPSQLSSSIAKTALVENDRAGPSSIGHNRTVPIVTLVSEFS
ncbi:MAG: glycosyltransferase family 25 protein [Pseudomonadota bacterium]